MSKLYVLVTLMLCLTLTDTKAQNQGRNLLLTVRTNDGKPAAEVFLQAEEIKQSQYSNKNGDAMFTNIFSKSITIKASISGYATVKKTFDLEENGTTKDSLILNLDEGQLEEVTVLSKKQKIGTAPSDVVAKMPLSNLENPQVYTTISSALTEQQLGFNAEAALTNAPGVTKIWEATNRIGSGGSWFSLRGFNAQIKARNGVQGNVNGAIDLANTDRIEIIKGPSATLFGNQISSYGGLINRITKKAYNRFGGTVDISAGSYGFNRLSADINTPLDKEGKILMRNNISYNRSNSFQDYGWNKSFVFAPSLTYKASDRLTFYADAEIINSQNSGGSQLIYFLTPSTITSSIKTLLKSMNMPDATIQAIMATAPKTVGEAYGTDNAKNIKIDYKRSYQSNDLVNKVNSTNLFGEAKYEISKAWTSQTVVSYASSDANGPLPYFTLLPNMLGNFVSSLAGGTPNFGTGGYDKMARMVWRTVGEEITNEIQQNFIGDFTIGKMRNRFVGGLDYYSYNSKNTYNRFTGSLYGLPFPDVFDIVNTTGSVPNYAHLNEGKVDSAFAAGPGSSLVYNTNNSVYSAYVNDVLNITEQLLISAGLRIDHFANKGSYDATSGTYSGPYNQTKLAPKFGLIFQPILNKLSLFGNYQTGFTNKTGTDASGKAFVPEQAFQWEVGVKGNLFDQRLSGTLSYYDIKVKDVVRMDINNPLFNIQDGTQRSKGFEAEINAIPVDGWNIIAGYGYNNSKMEKADPSVQGLRPIASGPQNAANFWTSYTFSSKALKGFTIGAGGNYAGEVFVVNSNIDGSFKLPAYTLLNGLISYENTKFRIAAKVNNLTNQHYWTGWGTFNPQMLRQFIGSIAFKF